MEPWKSQSSPGKQLMLSIAVAMVGIILMIGFRGFESLNSNAGAGFLLGVLLVFIGIPGFLLCGRQTVLVDPQARQIIVEDSNRFGTKRRSISFGEIEDIDIGYLGKKSNYVTCYYLALKLRNGESYPLFAPGRFYEGSSERSIVANWKRRIETYLSRFPEPAPS
jgi:hypothetical protein